MLRNINGPPAEDDDFFGREAESERLWQELAAGNNILLLGPRRVGKSSMLRHLKKTAPLHGFVPVEVSLADITEEIQFVQRLIAVIAQHEQGAKIVRKLASGPLSRHFKKLRKLGLGPVSFELELTAAPGWAELGESLTEALGTEALKWLILLDEVSVFVQHLLDTDPVRARTFLNWMRELRIGPRASRHNRWFITGSIGLPTITSAVSLGDTINDLCSPFDQYGPFTPEVATTFLHTLANNYAITFDGKVVERILVRVGWLIPYYLQNVFSNLRNLRTPLTPEIIDDIIHQMVRTRPLFSFWEERIRRHLKPPDANCALAILEPIARDPAGVTHEILSQSLAPLIADPADRKRSLRFYTDLLTSDGYIIRIGDRYQFLSPLLQEYWKRHVVDE